MADFTQDVKKVLSANGCHFKRRGKGDHDIWFSHKTNVSFPVDARIKSRHTANAILKQAGLKKQF